MNNYIGKICPFCKTEFVLSDEIVICSDCDMPHHKDCWIDNGGCTTFGCLGTIRSADSAVTTVTRQQLDYDDEANASVFCTKCGMRSPRTASFCFRCGNRLVNFDQQNHYSGRGNADPVNTNTQTSYAQQTPYGTPVYGRQLPFQQHNMQSNIVHQLIEVKSEYYTSKFDQLRSQNTRTSWNWAAFWVTPCWLIYRKMYAYGAAFLIASLLINLIMPGISSLILLAGNVTMGIYANAIYMDYVTKKAMQAMAMTEPMKSQFIIRNSGVNPLAVTLTLVAYVLLAAFLM